ncbi:MAG TPA: N-acetyltransferase [Acidimicrobiia bacterium]|nr:N-acetyltransferase [Acidimicrobiia bacterium]
MLIRAERPHDISEIATVVDAAFDSDRGRSVENVLIERLRGGPAWIPALSLVAEDGDGVVGQCLCTRAHVGETPVLALGPIAVRPDRQRAGIGTALMRTAIDIATDISEQLIGLVGDYGYYRRFGFVPASSLGVVSPEPSWGDYFQVLPLPGWRGVTGAFVYAEPFRSVSSG